MPVNIYTSDNDRIVHMDYVDPWSVTDLLATFPKQKVLCDGFSKPVIVMVDLLGTQRIPPGVVRARESPLLRSTHLEQIVAVGGPSIAKVLGEVVLKVAGFKKAQFFQTKEAAMQSLRKEFAQENLKSTIPTN